MAKEKYKIIDFYLNDKDNLKSVTFSIAGIKIETTFYKEDIDSFYILGYISDRRVQISDEEYFDFQTEYRIVDMIFTGKKDFTVIPKKDLEWMVTNFDENEDYLITLDFESGQTLTFQASTPIKKTIKDYHSITITDQTENKGFISRLKKGKYDKNKIEVEFP